MFSTAPVSTDGQTLDAQVAALKAACERGQDRLVQSHLTCCIDARRSKSFDPTSGFSRKIPSAAAKHFPGFSTVSKICEAKLER
jgi:hypothetical protein